MSFAAYTGVCRTDSSVEKQYGPIVLLLPSWLLATLRCRRHSAPASRADDDVWEAMCKMTSNGVSGKYRLERQRQDAHTSLRTLLKYAYGSAGEEVADAVLDAVNLNSES